MFWEKEVRTLEAVGNNVPIILCIGGKPGAVLQFNFAHFVFFLWAGGQAVELRFLFCNFCFIVHFICCLLVSFFAFFKKNVFDVMFHSRRINAVSVCFQIMDANNNKIRIFFLFIVLQYKSHIQTKWNSLFFVLLL